MHRTGMIAKTILLGSLCGAFLPGARADVWDKKTVVTFPEAVEIPGTVLQPGKYVLKLADSTSNRHIVRVFNEDENRVYATILAIPNSRLEPADKTVLTFYEVPGGQPHALRSWFYPGDTYGQEFAYPKVRATEIAQATGLTVPSPPPESEAGPMPETTESDLAPEEAAGALAPRSAGETLEPTETTQPAEAAQTEPAPSAKPETQGPPMPKTASQVPFVGLLGLFSVGAAVGLRVAAKLLSVGAATGNRLVAKRRV